MPTSNEKLSIPNKLYKCALGAPICSGRVFNLWIVANPIPRERATEVAFSRKYKWTLRNLNAGFRLNESVCRDYFDHNLIILMSVKVPSDNSSDSMMTGLAGLAFNRAKPL